MQLTLENTAFCSSEGYGFVMFYALSAVALQPAGSSLFNAYLIEPCLHNFGGLLWQVAALARLPLWVIVVARHEERRLCVVVALHLVVYSRWL